MSSPDSGSVFTPPLVEQAFADAFDAFQNTLREKLTAIGPLNSADYALARKILEEGCEGKFGNPTKRTPVLKKKRSPWNGWVSDKYHVYAEQVDIDELDPESKGAHSVYNDINYRIQEWGSHETGQRRLSRTRSLGEGRISALWS
jgi:hypothetical protein